MNGLKLLMARLSRTIKLVVGGLLVFVSVGGIIVLNTCTIYAPPDQCVVWISKSGAALSGDQEIAESGQRGIQRLTSGPGWHFFNPLFTHSELVPLVKIEAGDPSTLQWVHTASRLTHGSIRALDESGNAITGKLPEVGLLTRKTGKPHPEQAAVVPLDSGYKGIVAEVLTPGTYRINPYEFSVEKRNALVIPAGFVGVATNQVGEQPELVEVPDIAYDAPAGSQPGQTQRMRPLAEGDQRGTLRDVLPPGVYFLNPNLVRVKIIEIGFNEFSQLAGATEKETIRFPSKSGYDIELGVTVVWGLRPEHAAQVINEFGNTNEVLEKVIKPQLRSICRNEGSLYEARDFIRGDRREEFQQVLTDSLRRVCAHKNIELLLALISTIEVQSREQVEGAANTNLRTEIQDSYIALERQLTNTKLQETAKRKALLEEAKKQVDVMRETIQADTRKKVAELLADGERTAAEIEANGRLQVAEQAWQMATVDAEKVELLGRARTDVERLKQQAEADGKRILIEALGSGEAYNLYTFAHNFNPQSIKLFFAGEGTFWTDLSRLEDAGAATLLQQQGEKKVDHKSSK